MNCVYSFLVLALFLVTFDFGFAVKCGQNKDTGSGFRIVGGEEVVKGQVPWQVSILVHGDNHCCGGSIIAPNLVLTAAHCVDESVKGYKIYVVAGALVRKKGYKIGQMIEVKKIINHKGWNPKTAENDISLLLLTKNFKYTQSGSGPDSTAVGPICLPDKNWVYNGKAKISGFGKTTHGGTASTRLMFITETVMDSKICKQLFGRSNFVYDPKRMICYGNLKGGTGTCQGDSGGPLVVKLSDRWVQKGVVSYGSICGGKNSPSVFTSVPAYMDWIKSEAKKVGVTL